VVPVVVAVGLAFIMVALFVVLDYKFDQDPHRLVKIMLGVSVMCGILVWPRFGLVLLPVLTPFLGWLPKIPVPVLNPLNVLVVSIFLTWAIRRVLERRALFRPGRLGVALGAILGLAALSIVRGAALPTGYTYDAGAAAMMLFRSGMNFALYFIALSMVRGPRERRAVTWAVLLGLLAEALVTIKLGRSGRGARAIGSFGQANELGAFLAMFTVLGVALIPAVKRWGARLLLLGTVFAGAFATILTLSRGALVALVVGLFFVALRSSRALLVVLVLVLFSAPLWMPDFLRERIAGSTVEVQGSDEKGFDPSAQVRVDTWRAILSVVGDHPLDGVGFEGLSYVLPEAGEALGVEVVETAHNTYLRFLGEMGVFGLLLFVWLLWKCFQLGWAGARAAEDRFDRMLCVGLTGATVTMAVSCFFGDRFFSILITGNFWMLCALADDLLLERQGRTA
jgi:O-antigen ligase